MRAPLGNLMQEDEAEEINMTPMLDVVFIMLIFFIVTASVSYTHLTLPTICSV